MVRRRPYRPSLSRPLCARLSVCPYSLSSRRSRMPSMPHFGCLGWSCCSRDRANTSRVRLTVLRPYCWTHLVLLRFFRRLLDGLLRRLLFLAMFLILGGNLKRRSKQVRSSSTVYARADCTNLFLRLFLHQVVPCRNELQQSFERLVVPLKRCPEFSRRCRHVPSVFGSPPAQQSQKLSERN